MGKKSIKENKNIFFESREEAGLTRAQASELIGTISESRLEKMETEKTAIYPEDVVDMARAYKKPELCNYYCTHECPIGMKYVPEASLQDLSRVTVQIISALNAMEAEKNKLIDISVDGRINDFERKDFDVILEKINAIDRSIQGLRIWIEHAINTGKMDEAE